MLVSIMLLMLCADADVSTLPAPVRAALSSKWPKAKVLKVEVEEKEKFEVKLSSPEGTFELTFAKDGSVLGEERTVALKATPAAVQKTVASWTGWTVDHVEQVTEGKAVTFEIVARPTTAGAAVEIVLSSKGVELKRAAATE